MTPAEKEAYANADDSRVMLYTIELNHPQFTQPLRIVADNDPLDAEIEDGSTVTFTPFFFSMKRPPINEEPDPSLQITVDNVSGFLTPYLDIASRSGQSISVIFRVYLIDDSDGSITRLTHLKLAIRNASATMTSVTLMAAHINPANLPFPRETYTADRFPGLSS